MTDQTAAVGGSVEPSACTLGGVEVFRMPWVPAGIARVV